MIRESDIMHEAGAYWVLRTRGAYEVRKSVGTHSVDVAAFARTEDGLSCAIAYANYKAKHAA